MLAMLKRLDRDVAAVQQAGLFAVTLAIMVGTHLAFGNVLILDALVRGSAERLAPAMTGLGQGAILPGWTVRMACFAYIEGFYNPLRLHSALGCDFPVTTKGASITTMPAL